MPILNSLHTRAVPRSLCDSAFIKNKKPSVAETVVTTPLAILALTYIHTITIDAENLLAAVKESGAYETALKIYSDRRLAEYRKEFANVMASPTLERLNSFILRYASIDPDSLIKEAHQALAKAELTEAKAELTAASGISRLEAFIAKYPSAEFAGLVDDAKEKIISIKASALAEYREEFQSAKTVQDFEAFIQLHSQDDPDGLVPKARLSLNRLLKLQEEAQRREAAAREMKLVAWRKSLKIGDRYFLWANS
jgi:hypothetical protein